MTTNKNMIINNIPECPGNKNIQSAVISQNPPNNTNVLWLKPYSNQFSIKVHNGGQWVNCGVSSDAKGNWGFVNSKKTILVPLYGSDPITLISKGIVVYVEDYDTTIDLNEELLQGSDADYSNIVELFYTVDELNNIGTFTSGSELVHPTLCIIPIIKKNFNLLAKTHITFNIYYEGPFSIYIVPGVDTLAMYEMYDENVPDFLNINRAAKINTWEDYYRVFSNLIKLYSSIAYSDGTVINGTYRNGPNWYYVNTSKYNPKSKIDITFNRYVIDPEATDDTSNIKTAYITITKTPIVKND